ARRVLQLRRLEELALRRPAHLRAGGDRLLHALEGRHVALAGSGDLEGRSGLPADALGTVLLGEGADRVAVDPDPDAAVERLEQPERARARNDLGELVRGDRLRVQAAADQHGAVRSGGEQERQEAVAL